MNQNTLSWLYLLGAAVGQMAWTYSLKFINVADLKTLNWTTLHRLDGGLPILAPLIGYNIFGIVNSVLLAMAMRTTPTTTAVAAWMAGSLVIIKLVDVLWFRQAWSFAELFFILLIAVGIVGLKFVAPAA